MSQVSYDAKAVLINGQPQLILSGAVHYPRATPAMWPKILRESRRAGLNTIETYVFWNLHEHQRGCYDFSGRLDLPHFLELCRQEGFYVILRIGPYICAETNFGGLPPWLLEVKDLATRTNNKPFKRHTLEWCRVLMAKVGSYQAPEGGPIILVQLENEYNNVAQRYGAQGRKYIQWCASLGPALGLSVPMIMCEGAAPGVISTLNGFAVAQNVEAHRRRHPGQPLLWTENWTAWPDTFGHRRHQRDHREIAYQVLQFFAVGGTGVNYYMWFGGTNFDREAMYLQTTSYFFSAPLDEYGLPSTESQHLARLHQALLDNQALLLTGRPPQVDILVPPAADEALPKLALYTYSKDAEALLFAVNNQKTTATIQAGNKMLALPPQSASLLKQFGGEGRVLFASHEQPVRLIKRAYKPLPLRLHWQEFAEPLDRSGLPSYQLAEPVSMLPYTHDLSDYAFYTAILPSPRARMATLTLPMVRDFSSVFVNGVFLGTYPERLEENTPKHWKHVYPIALKKGRNTLTVLVAALGLIKNECQLDAPMNEEKKGLIGDILLNERPIKLFWTLTVGLVGEHLRCFAPASQAAYVWRDVARRGRPRLRWFKAEFGPLCDRALGYALDPGLLYKGMLYLNGYHLGRYWQLPSVGPAGQWWPSECILAGGDPATPTQQYYHLPKEYLRQRNLLVVFEETDAAPDAVRICERCAEERRGPSRPRPG